MTALPMVAASLAFVGLLIFPIVVPVSIERRAGLILEIVLERTVERTDAVADGITELIES